MTKTFQWLNVKIPLKPNEGIIHVAFDSSLFKLAEARQMLQKAGLATNQVVHGENITFWQTELDYRNFRDVQIIKGLLVRIGELI